jgi:two-component system, chemotaxis family, protein-glutamate methylesterase/glutaminase
MRPPVKVLIIDDSAVVRQTISEILGSDPEITVIGTASDPFAAARRIQVELPDVITLDVEMPRMDGITFLRKLMAQRPIPVVMCSSLTEQGSETLMQALEAGAVDVILKPRLGTAKFLMESKVRICEG